MPNNCTCFSRTCRHMYVAIFFLRLIGILVLYLDFLHFSIFYPFALVAITLATMDANALMVVTAATFAHALRFVHVAIVANAPGVSHSAIVVTRMFPSDLDGTCATLQLVRRFGRKTAFYVQLFKWCERTRAIMSASLFPDTIYCASLVLLATIATFLICKSSHHLQSCTNLEIKPVENPKIGSAAPICSYR